MNNEEKEMEDRFTPEGVPVTTPMGIEMNRIFNQPSQNTYANNKTKKRRIKTKNSKHPLNKTTTKIENTSNNEITQSLSVVIILILLGGLSWL